jgi:predicted RNase H-like HicB family nuclease
MVLIFRAVQTTTSGVEMKYLVIVEETGAGYSAYSPDLDGCVATGATRDEVELNMKEAIEFHIEGMKEEGSKFPVPHTYSQYLEVYA